MAHFQSSVSSVTLQGWTREVSITVVKPEVESLDLDLRSNIGT